MATGFSSTPLTPKSIAPEHPPKVEGRSLEEWLEVLIDQTCPHEYAMKRAIKAAALLEEMEKKVEEDVCSVPWRMQTPDRPEATKEGSSPRWQPWWQDEKYKRRKRR